MDTCISIRLAYKKKYRLVIRSGVNTYTAGRRYDKGIEDVKALRESRIDAVLIGELLMRSDNRVELLKSLRGIHD